MSVEEGMPWEGESGEAHRDLEWLFTIFGAMGSAREVVRVGDGVESRPRRDFVEYR